MKELFMKENPDRKKKEITNARKQEDYNQLVKKLNNPKTSFKTYWSTLRRFYNGKKIPLIPAPLLNNCLTSEFELKADFFIKFFVSQSIPLENSSNIRNNQVYLTNAKLDSI